MMDFIGIFIFIGILSVLFGERGWIPNEDIYAISLFVYSYVLPILVAYVTGNRVQETKEQPDGRKTGGVIAVMAEAGLLVADPQVGLLGTMLLGSLLEPAKHTDRIDLVPFSSASRSAMDYAFARADAMRSRYPQYADEILAATNAIVNGCQQHCAALVQRLQTLGRSGSTSATASTDTI